jgi:hypothetical protein
MLKVTSWARKNKLDFLKFLCNILLNKLIMNLKDFHIFRGSFRNSFLIILGLFSTKDILI